MRIWIYGQDGCAVRSIRQGIPPDDTVVGTSHARESGTVFPWNGLTQAMCKAIRGELDLLLVSDKRLLGDSAQQIQEMETAFRHYGALVRSASSSGSSSS